MKQLLTLAFVILIIGCKSASKSVKPKLLDNRTFKLESVSTDATYGVTEKNPIKVGGVKDGSGPLNERRYLNALAGPNGEKIDYFRRGSCCAFESKNEIFGGGLLDLYAVYWEGGTDTLGIYINMYDFDDKTLLAPKGLTIYSKNLKL